MPHWMHFRKPPLQPQSPQTYQIFIRLAVIQHHYRNSFLCSLHQLKIKKQHLKINTESRPGIPVVFTLHQNLGHELQK